MLDQNTLDQFTGTERYTSLKPLFPNVVLTDGVRYVAEQGGANGAFWLINAIASYQPQLMKHEMCQDMQFWTLTVNADKSADLVCVPDTDLPPVVQQHFERTDFDISPFKIWVAPQWLDDNKIVMVQLLPSEY